MASQSNNEAQLALDLERKRKMAEQRQRAADLGGNTDFEELRKGDGEVSWDVKFLKDSGDTKLAELSGAPFVDEWNERCWGDEFCDQHDLCPISKVVEEGGKSKASMVENNFNCSDI